MEGDKIVIGMRVDDGGRLGHVIGPATHPTPGEAWKIKYDDGSEETAGVESLKILKSWAVEVIADSSGKWAGNSVRLATKEEAEAKARDLMGRWMAVREWRVVESADEVNYTFGPEGLKSVEKAA